MDERVVQFRVGVTVLAALLITGILVLMFGEVPALIRGSYTVYIVFRTAPGISQDTAVIKSGIRVGRVTKMQFTPDNRVLVTAAVDGGVVLYRDEVVRIKTNLLGDAKLEFNLGPEMPRDRVPIKPGDLLTGSVTVDPLEAFSNLEGNLNRAASSLADAGSEVSKLAKNINQLLNTNDTQFSRLIDETETTLKLLSRTLGNVDDLIGDDKVKKDLKEAVSELPKVMHEVKDAITGIQKTVALADDNLRNIQSFTKGLDEHGEDMLNTASRSVERLDELLGQANRLSRSLNNREGTLGKILNDPALYDNLSQAAANVNRLTREAQPILCDARSLVDLLARHPGAPIRDAISPRVGIK